MAARETRLQERTTSARLKAFFSRDNKKDAKKEDGAKKDNRMEADSLKEDTKSNSAKVRKRFSFGGADSESR